MSASIIAGIFLDPDDPPRASLNAAAPEATFAVIELMESGASRVYIHIRNRAEAVAIIQAAAHARDLLPEGGAS